MTFQAFTQIVRRLGGMGRILATTCLVAAPLLTTPLFTSDARADFALTGFRQTVAEAAARDDALAAFYRAREFDGVWTGSDEAAQARRNALMTALSEAPLHGLPAGTFDAAALMAQMQAATTPIEQAEMDVELSRVFLAYARAINTGLLAPRDAVRLIVRDVQERDGLEVLEGFMTSTSPESFLRNLVPSSPEYTRLLRIKLDLEARLTTGGWGPAVPSSSLAPGNAGETVVALRNRLISMGYLGRSVTQTYDAVITEAVRDFQIAHGMAADGVAGAETIRQLNVPIAQRLERVLVAMERERWLNNLDRGDRYVWVNLTDFTAKIMDYDAEIFSTRSVIGAGGLDRQTPEFSDTMEYLVINPSWYIPRSIIVNEYLPALRSNSGAVGHLQIINSSGQVVSRNQNFSRFSASSFPYSMRQPPGPRNALGEVKFIFPNAHNIYLHDTPSQSLFQRDVRAFSHGCIRLDDPRDFAYTLLAAQSEDPEGLYHSYLRTGSETRVNLDVQVPVHIVYRTAFTDVEGRLQFRNDIYGRDQRIWEALSAAGVEIAAVQG